MEQNKARRHRGSGPSPAPRAVPPRPASAGVRAARPHFPSDPGRESDYPLKLTGRGRFVWVCVTIAGPRVDVGRQREPAACQGA